MRYHIRQSSTVIRNNLSDGKVEMHQFWLGLLGSWAAGLYSVIRRHTEFNSIQYNLAMCMWCLYVSVSVGPGPLFYICEMYTTSNISKGSSKFRTNSPEENILQEHTLANQILHMVCLRWNTSNTWTARVFFGGMSQTRKGYKKIKKVKSANVKYLCLHDLHVQGKVSREGLQPNFWRGRWRKTLEKDLVATDTEVLVWQHVQFTQFTHLRHILNAEMLKPKVRWIYSSIRTSMEKTSCDPWPTSSRGP